MAATEVTAKVKANAEKQIPKDLEAKVTYDFGESLSDAVAKFGETIVFETFFDAATVKLQAYMRALLVRGETSNEIQVRANSWKLGERSERPVDVVGELKGKLAGMSPEEQLEYIRNLAASAGVQIESLS